MEPSEKKGSIVRLLFSYLLSRRRTILAFIAFFAIHYVVYLLYQIPLEPALYVAELVFVLGLLLGSIGFWRYQRKHRALWEMLTAVTVDLRGMPDAMDAIETDYQALIRFLRQDSARVISERDHRQAEMSDYYTLWAHQIKTPIAAMRLLLQSGEASGRHSDLEQELFKIECYSEMVLHYLRLESLSADLVLQGHDLLAIVRQALRKYAPVFIHKNLSLVMEPFSITVLTDEKWLVFVIEQILSNALKYTPSGKVSIYPDPDAERTLVIEDTGIGIRQEDIPRIFERGFTGYNGRTDLGQRSTGIGLYLCHQILGKLSHTLSVSSEVGRGTKIRIVFARLTEM